MPFARLSLSDYEMEVARNRGCEVQTGTWNADSRLYEDTKLVHPSVSRLVSVLRSLPDLRDYSDEELEEYYIHM